jgi:hypothetical protein
MPAADLAAELTGHIHRICEALGCPPHDPHVTVLGDVRVAGTAAERAIESLAPTYPPLALGARSIASSAARFEALTIRFHPSTAFQAMATALRRHLALPPAAPAEPHLSLAYPREPFDPAALVPLAQGVALANQMLFDRVALVDPGPGRQDWHDVGAWRVIRSRPLAITTSTRRT